MDNSEREIFWKTLCDLDGKDIVSDSLKLQTAIKYPHSICRYRSVTLNSIEALQTNKLYFSSADYYDDPFDTYLSIDWEFVKTKLSAHDYSSQSQFETLLHVCKELGVPTEKITFDRFSALDKELALKNTIYHLAEVIRPHIQKHLFSIAFAEDPLNENLWLKYANNHKGFCLEYNLHDEPSSLIKKPNHEMSLYPVYYSNEKYNATDYAISTLGYYVIEACNLDAARAYQQSVPMWWETEKVSLIKHKCHEYDAEWRIISHAHQRTFIKCNPTSIYIGLKTESNERKLIVRAAVQAGIKHIYNVVISPTDKLDVEELTAQDIINNYFQ